MSEAGPRKTDQFFFICDGSSAMNAGETAPLVRLNKADAQHQEDPTWLIHLVFVSKHFIYSSSLCLLFDSVCVFNGFFRT